MKNFYGRWVFPSLCDLAMKDAELSALLQRLLGDGCRLDVDIEAVVRAPRFADVVVERFVLDRLPRVFGSMYRGTAVRAAPA